MQRSATVTEIEQLAPSVIQITVSFNGGALAFSPGQWVNFRFPEGVSRAYTIASAPERPEAVQLCVRLGPGKGGSALQNLVAGASVTIDGPHGDFLLPKNDGRPVVLLAGDTGIAPIRSIVLHMVASKDQRKPVVLYEPDQRNILYAGDFDPIARAGDIIYEAGRIETLIERNRDTIPGAIIMAAGFDGFLDRGRAEVERVGGDPDAILSESFGPQP